MYEVKKYKFKPIIATIVSRDNKVLGKMFIGANGPTFYPTKQLEEIIRSACVYKKLGKCSESCFECNYFCEHLEV